MKNTFFYIFYILVTLQASLVSAQLNSSLKPQNSAVDSVALKIVGINELETNKLKGHPLIYLSGRQWKDFIKEAVSDNKNPSDSIGYDFIVIPLGDNPYDKGVILFSKPCNPGCKEDIWGKCQCANTQTVSFCSLRGTIGNRYCSGLCTGVRQCRMYFRQETVNGFNVIRVRCRCE